MGRRIILSASDQGASMNAFHEHHRDSIRFGYRCFDRILLNGLIQPFQICGAWPAGWNTFWKNHAIAE